jgi:hypothetical protein
MNEKALFERLDRQNDIIQQISDKMPKPASMVTRVLEKALVIVGIFSGVSVADTIMKWIIGG